MGMWGPSSWNHHVKEKVILALSQLASKKQSEGAESLLPLLRGCPPQASHSPPATPHLLLWSLWSEHSCPLLCSPEDRTGQSGRQLLPVMLGFCLRGVLLIFMFPIVPDMVLRYILNGYICTLSVLWGMAQNPYVVGTLVKILPLSACKKVPVL